MCMNVLDKILDELQLYKHDKTILLKFYINKRLNKSLQVYYEELSYYINSLKNEDILKLMNKLNKR